MSSSPKKLSKEAHARAVAAQAVMFAGGATFGAVAEAYPALLSAAYRGLEGRR